MTSVARARGAPPRRDPEVARLLEWADRAIGWLDDHRNAQPETSREWSIWQAGRAVGFEQGYQHGRHALFDEADEADQRAYLLWRATQHRGWQHPEGRNDPAFRRWADQRNNPRKRR